MVVGLLRSCSLRIMLACLKEFDFLLIKKDMYFKTRRYKTSGSLVLFFWHATIGSSRPKLSRPKYTHLFSLILQASTR